jgi:hypothetical protein
MEDRFPKGWRQFLTPAIRKLLEPYGTPYRHQMTRKELIEVAAKFERMEKEKAQ